MSEIYDWGHKVHGIICLSMSLPFEGTCLVMSYDKYVKYKRVKTLCVFWCLCEAPLWYMLMMIYGPWRYMTMYAIIEVSRSWVKTVQVILSLGVLHGQWLSTRQDMPRCVLSVLRVHRHKLSTWQELPYASNNGMTRYTSLLSRVQLVFSIWHVYHVMRLTYVWVNRKDKCLVLVMSLSQVLIWYHCQVLGQWEVSMCDLQSVAHEVCVTYMIIGNMSTLLYVFIYSGFW